MNILIIGGGGFIGINLVKKLEKKNKLLVIRKKKQPISTKIKHLYIDIKDISLYKDTINNFQPSIAYNLYWENIPDFSLYQSKKNYNNSVKILKVLSEINSIKKIIVTGSGIELKRKISSIDKYFFLHKYKRKFFELIKSNKIRNKIYWCRLYFVYGPYQRKGNIFDEIFSSLLNRKKPKILNLYSKNNYIFVGEVVDRLSNLISYRGSKRVFNIKSLYDIKNVEICFLIR